MNIDTGAIIQAAADQHDVSIDTVMNKSKLAKAAVQARHQAIHDLCEAGVTHGEIAVTMNISRFLIRQVRGAANDPEDALDNVSPKIRALCAQVSRLYGCYVGDVLNMEIRYHEVVAARRLLVWTLNQRDGMTLQKIEQATGIRWCSVGSMISVVKKNGGRVPHPIDVEASQAHSKKGVELDTPTVRMAIARAAQARNLIDDADHHKDPSRRVEAKRLLQVMGGGHTGSATSSASSIYTPEHHDTKRRTHHA